MTETNTTKTKPSRTDPRTGATMLTKTNPTRTDMIREASQRRKATTNGLRKSETRTKMKIFRPLAAKWQKRERPLMARRNQVN